LIRYLDTSLLVASLTEEDETDRIQTWLNMQDAGTLLISEWVVTEFSAALSVKLRRNAIEPDRRARALQAFAIVIAESLAVTIVTTSDFRKAAQLADRSQVGLRAGDALHLAVAIRHGATLCTLDRRLAQAGTEFGASAVLV
jgi:predicted nucleic acid-binding protein